MKIASKTAENPFFWLGAALVIAGGMKTWLVMGGWLPFNSDEAVVALMARHILGGDRPAFFYGQAYMGSLDAFFVAGAFAVFGEQVWAIRLVQSLLFLVFLVTTAFLGRRIFGSWAVGSLAALLLAVPPVNLALYTTVSLGGYGEALLIGNLILLAALSLYRSWMKSGFPGAWLSWVSLGFFCGLGFWSFGITLVYAVPAWIFLGWEVRRFKPYRKAGMVWVMSLIGALVGSLPWWLAAIQEGPGKLLGELGGSAISGVEGLGWLSQTLQHILNLILFGLTAAIGLRPPWDLVWLGGLLAPFALAFWLGVFVWIFLTHRDQPQHEGDDSAAFEGRWMLTGVILVLVAAFILTPFGADPSGRYFLPLAAPLALYAADMIVALKRRYGARTFSLVGMLLLFQLAGILQSGLKYPPGITTQFYSPTQVDHRYDPILIDFLLREGETRGYTNYWTAYPLAFLSQERLIFIPRLPYHLDLRYTARDDRYPLYTGQVAAASRAAYITTRHPELDSYLRDQFISLDISFQEAQIGDYRVFYRLSRPVQPVQIGLGGTTSPIASQ